MTSETFTHPLKPGLYTLREDFVSKKVDRRLAGNGFGTLQGFKKGTKFTLCPAPWRDVDDFVLQAPFSGTTHEIVGFRAGDNEDISWGAPVGVDDLSDVERLFNLLDPDHTTESFVNHVTGRDYYSDGCAFAVLVALLEAGVVSRELVASIAKEKSDA